MPKYSSRTPPLSELMFKPSEPSLLTDPFKMIGPLPYIGGKNRLATKIISLLPEHTTYVEPFAGGAQVLFHKPPSNVEVLNDLDFDVVNFFRVCQWHSEELVRYLRFCFASRRLHELHVKSDPATLTDIQRAGRFYNRTTIPIGFPRSSSRPTVGSNACRSNAYHTTRS